MKILLVNYEFPPVGGGGGVASFQLARQWARHHEVDCITSRAADLPARAVASGVRLYRVPTLGRRDLDAAPITSLLCYPASGLWPGLELFARRRYDVINTHFAIPSGPLGAALAALCRAPNVVCVHGGDLYDPTKRISPHRLRPAGMVVRSVLRAADLIVAQSSDTAANALTYYGADLQPKLCIVPLPFDPPPAQYLAGGRNTARAEAGIGRDGFCLVSVGRLIARKGYDRLILSLLRLPDTVRLVLVGDGPLGAELRSLAASNGLGGRVTFTGRVSERDKYRRLLAADCYVLSSHHEGFGIVLQEAMSVGLPIVATSHGGQREILTDGVNALLVEDNEPQTLAAAVQRLMADAPLLRAMAASNRRKVEEFRAEAVADRYLELFRGVMGKAKGT
jgi:glycosyltransferase involved in cell wall biosynthesis